MVEDRCNDNNSTVQNHALSGILPYPYQAVAVFRRALEIHPRDAEIYYNMGVTLQTLGMAQEAAQSFTTVLDINPQVTSNNRMDTRGAS